MAVCGSCGYRVSELALECGRCRGPIPIPAPVSVSQGATSAASPADARQAAAPPAARPVVQPARPAVLPPPPPPPSSALPPSSPVTPAPYPSAQAPETEQFGAVSTPPPPPAEPSGRIPVSRAVIAIVVAAAVIVIVMIVAIALGQGDPADDSAATDQAPAAEVATRAEVEVPGTADDGVDSAGEPVSYAAANLTDGDPSTAWRVDGDAEGEEIVLTLPASTAVTEVGIVNGYAKVDDDSGDRRYGQNRRVLAATWIFDDGTEATFELEETPELQTFTLDAPAETTTVRVRLDEVSDPGGRDFTAIGELSLRGR